MRLEGSGHGGAARFAVDAPLPVAAARTRIMPGARAGRAGPDAAPDDRTREGHPAASLPALIGAPA